MHPFPPNSWQRFLASQHPASLAEQLPTRPDPSKLIEHLNRNIMTDLSYLGHLHIQGPAASQFLQGQVSCDIKAISTTQTTLGAYCNIKGRILCLFRGLPSFDFAQQPGYLLQMPLTLLSSAAENFNKYALFSKVNIAPAPLEHVMLGLAGPQFPQWLNQYFAIHCPSAPNQCLIFDYQGYSVRLSRVAGVIPRFELYAHHDIMRSIWEYFSPQCDLVKADSWQLHDIFSHQPEITVQTSLQFLPAHINLPELGGVSFTKGCYLGQEIIARMHYLGKIKKHLYSGQVQVAHCQAGDTVMVVENANLKPVGTVIQACELNTGYFACLMSLTDAYAQSNLHLKQSASAIIKPLPKVLTT